MGDEERRTAYQTALAGSAVVAALVVTLTYTAVLTPPRELSDCQSLCVNQQLDGLLASTLASQQANEGVLKAVQTVYALPTPSPGIGTPVVRPAEPAAPPTTTATPNSSTNSASFNSSNSSTGNAGTKKATSSNPHLTSAATTFLFLNATALFLSLGAVVLSCAGGILVFKEAEVADWLALLIAVNAFLLLGVAFAFAAFITAHYIVFNLYLEDNTGNKVTILGTISAALAGVVFMVVCNRSVIVGWWSGLPSLGAACASPLRLRASRPATSNNPTPAGAHTAPSGGTVPVP